jgi:hypothetical protein
MATKIVEGIKTSDRELRQLNDTWANAFANRLGTDSLPSKRAKNKFIGFVLSEVREDNEELTESYITNQFPKFISYLAEF